MQVSEQQLLDDGFIVIRQVIRPQHLDRLRHSFEILVDRQRAIWARQRQDGDPPGGVWETHPQPRLAFNNLVDESTADTVEFCLGDSTLGVSQQLFRGPEAAITSMFFMCNPTRDHGPAEYKNRPANFFSWHRDIDPSRETPLSGLQMDFLENGAGYVQWNIPLYDDDVLWVVPGSHRRLNTDTENRQLLEDPRVPLPGSIPVELKAGDGVVYSNMILHWGSNYSTKLRRTIHLGYRSFGGPSFPYQRNFYWNFGFEKHLSPASRAVVERFAELQRQEHDLVVSTFRAIIAKDTAAFRDGLASLHPGGKGRMVALVLLCSVARQIIDRGATVPYTESIADRFSPQEREILRQRFAALEAELQAGTEQYVPGFQGTHSRYYCEEMPSSFDVDNFVASWEERTG